MRQENAAVVDVHHGVAFHPILKAASSAVHNEMRYLDGHNFRIAADDTNIREVKASCCDDGSFSLNLSEQLEVAPEHVLFLDNISVCGNLPQISLHNRNIYVMERVPKNFQYAGLQFNIGAATHTIVATYKNCLLYTSPSPRD